MYRVLQLTKYMQDLSLTFQQLFEVGGSGVITLVFAEEKMAEWKSHS